MSPKMTFTEKDLISGFQWNGGRRGGQCFTVFQRFNNFSVKHGHMTNLDAITYRDV